MKYRYETIAKRLKNKNAIGVEVGVFQGSFSRQILENIDGVFLYMVDAWSSATYNGVSDDAVSPEWKIIYENQSAKNLEKTKINVSKFPGRYRIIKSDSISASGLFDDDSLDFVFIDAAHDYESVRKDIFAWLPKIKKGGFICGHDYPNFKGVVKAVDEVFGDKVNPDFDYTWFVKL